jgi:hypothetical protein
MEKLWKIYVDKMNVIDDCLKYYKEMREVLQSHGIKEEQLERGHRFPVTAFQLRERCTSELSRIIYHLRTTGWIRNDEEKKEFVDYVVEHFKDIDKQTPLK